jgi:hypothetical protein
MGDLRLLARDGVAGGGENALSVNWAALGRYLRGRAKGAKVVRVDGYIAEISTADAARATDDDRSTHNWVPRAVRNQLTDETVIGITWWGALDLLDQSATPPQGYMLVRDFNTWKNAGPKATKATLFLVRNNDDDSRGSGMAVPAQGTPRTREEGRGGNGETAGPGAGGDGGSGGGGSEGGGGGVDGSDGGEEQGGRRGEGEEPASEYDKVLYACADGEISTEAKWEEVTIGNSRCFAWGNRAGYIEIMKRSGQYATDLELEALAIVLQAQVTMVWNKDAVPAASFIWGDKDAEEVRFVFSGTGRSGGHFSRVVLGGDGNENSIVDVRGDGNCAFYVAATHTIGDLLTTNRGKVINTELYRLPTNPAMKRKEDNEAARLRQEVVRVLRRPSFAPKIAVSGNTF